MFWSTVPRRPSAAPEAATPLGRKFRDMSAFSRCSGGGHDHRSKCHKRDDDDDDDDCKRRRRHKKHKKHKKHHSHCD
jgi:hypothetical protein